MAETSFQGIEIESWSVLSVFYCKRTRGRGGVVRQTSPRTREDRAGSEVKSEVKPRAVWEVLPGT